MSAALYAAIDEAFVYTFPLYEVARTRLGDARGSQGVPRLAIDGLPSNTVLHDPRVCDHLSRWVTTPNNDTLYSRAWIDLSTGPVRVEIAALPPDRYWSVAFMDAWTNNFSVIGGHTDGIGPVTLTLVGPQGAGDLNANNQLTHGGRVIQAPGNDVWLLARWLVDPEGDPSLGHAMQACLRVVAVGQGRPIKVMTDDTIDAAKYVAIVCERMVFNPPPAADDAILKRIAETGLQPSLTSPWMDWPEALRQAWTMRLGMAQDVVRALVSKNRLLVQGWWTRTDSIGNFGTDYAERAAIALVGLGALPAEEAVYAGRAHDDDGEPLHGRHNFYLTIPATGIATDSFWSISLYELAPDARRFFVDNPIRRYAIGDRTPGLRYESDGSLRIWIQNQAPDNLAQRANWLPAPAGGFNLTLRAYRPRPELRAWTSPLPTVTRVS